MDLGEKEQREERREDAEMDICEHFAQQKDRNYVNNNAVADQKKSPPMAQIIISYTDALQSCCLL